MKNKKLYLAPECEFQELEPENSLLTDSTTEGIEIPVSDEEDF